MTGKASDALVRVATLGCRLNAYESERISALVDSREPLTIVNGCAVTNEAVRQTRQTARKLKRERPDAKVILTGCLVDTDAERLKTDETFDGFVSTADKLNPAAYARALGKKVMPPPRDVHQEPPRRRPDRTRAMLQVQTGCDHRCTFCIIPVARGKSRSRSLCEVQEACKALVGQGVRDVTLTGVDLTSYRKNDEKGRDARLGDLVEALLKAVPDLERLRLSSLDPGAIDPKLLELMQGELRLMPSFHFSMQAGHDLILKRMKRRHSVADIERLCDSLRDKRPDVVLGADLIAGFPTESDEHFRCGYDLVRRLRIALLHVFPFSPRPGTPAARINDFDPRRARARAAALRELGRENLRHLNRGFLGQSLPVLFESAHHGRTPHNLFVHAKERHGVNALLDMRIVKVEEGRLIGEAQACEALGA